MESEDGLLEHAALLIAPAAASGRRPLLDAETGAPLGFGQPPPAGWWRRLLGSVVAVHERQDDSLLFTVRRCRPLSVWHEVRDADDHPVGWHSGELLLDRVGHRLGRREVEGGPGTSRFAGPDGRVLARLARQGENVLLTFTDVTAGEPFLKMLLLAAALRW